MSRYSIHPLEQSFQDWEAKRKANRHAYWGACALARQEYLAENKGNFDLTSRPRLDFWMNEKYGFQMGFDEIDGGITENYTVTDPKKFMLFQIKFWK